MKNATVSDVTFLPPFYESNYSHGVVVGSLAVHDVSTDTVEPLPVALAVNFKPDR